jgi:hypothetical protein
LTKRQTYTKNIKAIDLFALFLLLHAWHHLRKRVITCKEICNLDLPDKFVYYGDKNCCGVGIIVVIEHFLVLLGGNAMKRHIDSKNLNQMACGILTIDRKKSKCLREWL